jgi:hypothetical protein
MAAGTIQCPKCGLLNDVPTLSDLENIAEDGTLLLKDDVVKPERDRVAQVKRAFRPGRVDDQGHEIDLRPTQKELAGVNSTEIPFADAPGPGVRLAKPKYDPVTGELIQPLDVARADLPKAIPVAKRSLTYAAGEAKDVLTPAKIFVKMFEPANAVVMVFIFVFYFIFQAVGLLAMGFLAMLGLPWVAANIPLGFLAMAHYVNTIDDNGPQMMDELPRPLRHFSWFEDMWAPFTRMAASLGFCFLPALILWHKLPARFEAAALIPAMIGLFFFPAVLLTMITSGTYANLRPDRLMGVVRAAGGGYLLSLVLWVAALPLFAFSLLNLFMFPAAWREEHEWIEYLNKAYIGFPLLFIGIIMMHFASWHLGLLYQRHHANFPWVFQRHISKRQQEENEVARQLRAESRKRRYASTTTRPPAQ